MHQLSVVKHSKGEELKSEVKGDKFFNVVISGSVTVDGAPVAEGGSWFYSHDHTYVRHQQLALVHRVSL